MADLVKNRLRIVNLVGAVTIALGVVAPTTFGIAKLYKHGHESIQQSADLKHSLADLDGLDKTLQQVEAEKKLTESRLNDAEARLPSSTQMDEFMQQLAKVASNAGMQIDSTTPRKTFVTADGYRSTPVDITGVGDWDTCYRFLTGLRAMNRLTRLDSLTLDVDKEHLPTNATRAKPLCKITVSISTFMAR
jgi:Tfp pilus assembly protein PilO